MVSSMIVVKVVSTTKKCRLQAFLPQVCSPHRFARKRGNCIRQWVTQWIAGKTQISSSQAQEAVLSADMEGFLLLFPFLWSLT